MKQKAQKIFNKIIFGGVLYFLFTAVSIASDMGGEDLPWLKPLETITNAISGPVAKLVGVVAIVLAGLGIAFGESGSGVRRLFQVVMGLAIAFTAASIVASWSGGSSGVVF
ncbi:TrbC/VirB2 family protein [Thiotrichales bacterium 19S11-10]|nr:TrbC/VirB2 family protein [Thiotrichales bacterium 19S11-10]MCF6808153.1 TrbC/VirB2 family protein [Thiotrichales bacterium 19S9-11]MCF6812169.1 TrbC/VirB2 family protein [Thiotrichales bacterium 19S9-12]